jgi:hypothetical protein
MVSSLSWFHIAKAYTTVYAICYIISPILSLQIVGVNPTITSGTLILIGIGLIYSIHTKNSFCLFFLCSLEAVGCVAHYLRIIPWLPTFSDNGYLLMSFLDLCQAVLIYLVIDNNSLQKKHIAPQVLSKAEL